MSPRSQPGQTRTRIFEFVRRRILEGNPPTVREVQHKFGFRAVESARAHLEALVDQGLLAKSPGRRSRAYRLPSGRGAPVVHVPLLGSVQAGSLTTAIQEAEGTVPVQTRRAATGEVFALRVRGNSMSGAAILDGDIVIVRRQPSAASGDVVVAMVADEATVKRLRVRRGRIELHPENPAHQVIIPEASEVQILGTVVEVRRQLEPPRARPSSR